MRWLDDGKEMLWFSKQREVRHDELKRPYRILSLYSTHSGNVFCKLTIRHDLCYKIEALDFFEEIKEELYEMAMRDIASEEAPYSYDRWIMPLFRERKLQRLLTD